MSYTPTVWNENDIITAEKLNNLESGIDNIFEITADLTSLLTGKSYDPITVKLYSEQIQKFVKSNINFIKVNVSDSNFCIFSKNIEYNENSGVYYLYNNGIYLICVFENFSEPIPEFEGASGILMFTLDSSSQDVYDLGVIDWSEFNENLYTVQIDDISQFSKFNEIKVEIQGFKESEVNQYSDTFSIRLLKTSTISSYGTFYYCYTSSLLNWQGDISKKFVCTVGSTGHNSIDTLNIKII